MVSVHFSSSNLKKYLYIAIALIRRLYIAKLLIAILRHASHSKNVARNLLFRCLNGVVKVWGRLNSCHLGASKAYSLGGTPPNAAKLARCAAHD